MCSGWEIDWTLTDGGMMVMHRKKMVEAGAPHNKGITWEKFCEHRGEGGAC